MYSVCVVMLPILLEMTGLWEDAQSPGTVAKIVSKSEAVCTHVTMTLASVVATSPTTVALFAKDRMASTLWLLAYEHLKIDSVLAFTVDVPLAQAFP